MKVLRTRVMPCLLIKDRGLVKTIKFREPQYVGDPINAVRIFNQKEVDELILLDINSTTLNKNIQFDLIEKITSECFMPLCYGGGVRTLDDFQKLFYMGVEKVSISSLLFINPGLVKKAISIYGSQSLVVTLDIRKSWLSGKYHVYTHSARTKIKKSLLEVVDLATSLGVGEIIVNSIDRDGTWGGLDLGLVKLVAEHVTVPVVALGGAGKLEHIKQVVDAGASAVGIGSMAVFQAQNMGVLIKFPKLSELEALFQ